jgi:hypothetical protein
MVSRQNPFWDAVKIKKEIPNVSLSVRSIRHRLNEIGLYGRKPVKRPFISAQNRRARLQFAKEHLNWTPRQWKKILCFDETKFNLCSSDGIQWVRRPKNERFNPKYTRGTVKHGGNVKFWECFSAHGVGSLHFNTHFARSNASVCRGQYAPSMDNDPKHRKVGVCSRKSGRNEMAGPESLAKPYREPL